MGPNHVTGKWDLGCGMMEHRTGETGERLRGLGGKQM